MAGQMDSCHLRQGHTAAVYDSTRVIIFGGYGPGGLDRDLTCFRGTLTGSEIDTAVSGPVVPAGPTPPPGSGGRRRAKRYEREKQTVKDGFLKDVLEYDTVTGAWRPLATWGSAHDHRAGHSAVMYRHKMLVWGGWEVMIEESMRPLESDALCDFGDPKVSYKLVQQRRGDLCCLDMRSLRWKRVRQEGKAPRHRSDHTAVKVGHTMVVYGGETEREGTEELDEAPRSPSPVSDSSEDDLLDTARRERQASKQCGTRKPQSSRTFLGDVCSLDLETRTWQLISATGDIPQPRSGHSASTVKIHGVMSMVVCGGEGESGLLGSCYALDFDAQDKRHRCCTWRQILCQSSRTRALRTAFPPRAFHASVAIPLRERGRGTGEATSPARTTTAMTPVSGSPGTVEAADRVRSLTAPKELAVTASRANSVVGAASSEASERPLFQLLLFGGDGKGSEGRADSQATYAKRRRIAGGTTTLMVGYPNGRVAGETTHLERMKCARSAKVEDEEAAVGGLALNLKGAKRTQEQLDRYVERLAYRSNAYPGARKWAQKQQKALQEQDAYYSATVHAKALGAMYQGGQGTPHPGMHGNNTTIPKRAGKLTSVQQEKITERMYYIPSGAKARVARHRKALRDAGERGVVKRDDRKTLTAAVMRESVERLYYRAMEQIGERNQVVEVTQPPRRLEREDVEALNNRLHYESMEKSRDKRRTLERKHLGRRAKPPLVRDPDEWRDTIRRLHDAPVGRITGKYDEEDLNWGVN